MGQVVSLPDYVGSGVRATNRVLSAPIVGNVDTVHLFLVVGAVILSVIVWSRILAHIKG